MEKGRNARSILFLPLLLIVPVEMTSVRHFLHSVRRNPQLAIYCIEPPV